MRIRTDALLRAIANGFGRDSCGPLPLWTRYRRALSRALVASFLGKRLLVALGYLCCSCVCNLRVLWFKECNRGRDVIAVDALLC